MSKRIIVILASTLCLLSGCGEKQLSEQAKSAQSAIDSLPATYSETVEDDYNNAKSLYSALSDEDKKDVKKEKLDELEKSREEIVVKPAEDLNKKIKDLTIKSETAKDIDETNEQLEDVFDLLKKLPKVALKQVKSDDLKIKVIKACEDGKKTANNVNNDVERFSNAISCYSSACDWVGVNNVSAYSEILNAISYLEKIKNYDASETLNAMRTLASYLRDIAAGGSVTEETVSAAKNVETKINVLRIKISVESKPILESMQKSVDITKQFLDFFDECDEINQVNKHPAS